MSTNNYFDKMQPYKKHLISSDSKPQNVITSSMDKLLGVDRKAEVTTKKLKLVANSLEKNKLNLGESIKIKALKNKPNSNNNTKKLYFNQANYNDLSIIDSSNKSLAFKSPIKLSHHIKKNKKHSTHNLHKDIRGHEKSNLMILMQGNDKNLNSSKSNINLEKKDFNFNSAKKLRKVSPVRSHSPTKLKNEKNFKSAKEVPNPQKSKMNKIPLSIFNDKESEININSKSPKKKENKIQPQKHQEDNDINFKDIGENSSKFKSEEPQVSKKSINEEIEEAQSIKNELVIFENTSNPGINIDIKFCRSIGSITENIIVSKSMNKNTDKGKKKRFLGCLPICF